jgi:hypothetical protein
MTRPTFVISPGVQESRSLGPFFAAHPLQESRPGSSIRGSLAVRWVFAVRVVQELSTAAGFVEPIGWWWWSRARSRQDQGLDAAALFFLIFEHKAHADRLHHSLHSAVCTLHSALSAERSLGHYRRPRTSSGYETPPVIVASTFGTN